MPTIDAPRARALRSYDDLPGPRGLPWVGHLLRMDSTRVHQQFEHWCEVYGPVYRVRLGRRRAIVIGDHELISAALRDRPEGFRRTTRLEQVWTEMGLLGGVFGASGEDWRRQRRMVMAGLDPGHVRRYYPFLLRIAGRLQQRWGQAADEGRPLELQAELMRFTVDAVAGLAFGADVNTLQSDEDVIQQHLNRIFPAVFRRLFSPLPTWRLLPSAQDRALVRSVREVRRAVDGFIAAARERLRADPALREQPGNLLEAMLVEAQRPGSELDDAQIAGNVLIMLLAGEDTTANTLAWLIYLLNRHPEALALARREVCDSLGAQDLPSLAQIAQLDFVEACAQEAMRLHPVAPINTLQALRDTQLDDVHVPAGMVLVCVMRRDAVHEAQVPEAARFLPQRWLPGDAGAALAGHVRRVSMPFGAGPRICPGRYLALMEIKLVMALLLRHFEIERVATPDGQAPRELMQLAMAPVGLSMRLRRAPA